MRHESVICNNSSIGGSSSSSHYYPNDEFEQFGSRQMCAPAAEGLEPGTPGLWVNHATNELYWHIYTQPWYTLVGTSERPCRNPADSYLYLYLTWQYALLCYRATGALAPHCGFSGFSPDGNCAYHWGSFTSNSSSVRRAIWFTCVLWAPRHDIAARMSNMT